MGHIGTRTIGLGVLKSEAKRWPRCLLRKHLCLLFVSPTFRTRPGAQLAIASCCDMAGGRYIPKDESKKVIVLGSNIFCAVSEIKLDHWLYIIFHFSFTTSLHPMWLLEIPSRRSKQLLNP